MPSMIRYSSSSFDERDPAVPLKYIILHYTGMKTGQAALDRLCDPTSKVSCHYMVEEDGRLFKLVDESKRAWHAGQSFWRGITDLNSASIGVEIVNPGHQFGYRAFPSAQIEAVRNLVLDIVGRYHMDPKTAVLAHADVAPGRKEDPGELFPWQTFAEQNGIGVWPQPVSSDYTLADDAEVQKLLTMIGYQCPTHGDYDRPTRAALLAFQRHYHPDNVTGTPEKETIARLRDVERRVSGAI